MKIMKKIFFILSSVQVWPSPFSAGLSTRLRSVQLKSVMGLLSAAFFAVIAMAAISACTENNPSNSHRHGQAVSTKELRAKILFVLGQDFYQYSDFFTYLYEIYDAESIKANIHILSYSDMTAKTKQPRLSMITERLDAQPFDVMISVGIPEGGGRILRTVKEKHPALPILSLLPVEEIPPLEAYSTLVADFELPDSFAKADRAIEIPPHDLRTLLLCAVTAADQIDEIPAQEPFPRFARAIATAEALLTERGIPAWGGTPYTLHPYKDPELNIRSYNYLILSQTLAEVESSKEEAHE